MAWEPNAPPDPWQIFRPERTETVLAIPSIQIGSITVGPGSRCFLVAEIGINHNGDMDLAREMIHAAADAGADAVKFQNYHTEDFLSDRSITYRYVSQGGAVSEPQYDLFKRCELSKGMLRDLKHHCDHRGIGFQSTPTGIEGIEELIKLGAPVLKNGSDYLTHLPLIRAMGKTGLPTVISTGMATLSEIDDAVRAFRRTGNDQLILLHCTSSYPTPPAEVNLQKIKTLQTAFECPVGFSDHTQGIVPAIGAVMMQACWIEKHFTLDKDLPGPDHRFSADPSEFKALVNAVRTAEKIIGRSAIGPTSSESESRRSFRLSCVAARDLPEGKRLSEADIAFRRPGTGWPPGSCELLAGRRLARSVPRGHIFQKGDLI